MEDLAPDQRFQFQKGVAYPDRLCWCKKQENENFTLGHTVRKMDPILRSIERRPQMQFSMARRFKLQLLRRYSVKFCKMCNFTLGAP